jgi:hypothetical protein
MFCENMGWLYLDQDRGMIIRVFLSRSGYGFECMGCLHLGQDRGMWMWAVCN